ncbi:glucose-1-phosphate adenylyltransferase [Neobacillus niacini]|uniref:glucose-1-phosphate adenylyltransferase n=1 Tax=Neobacillus niacini TaxID=86668 RepID=UPI00203B5986|nr:glucose-1-phosphate adenylyltransferase [Neobacillus niacini]
MTKKQCVAMLLAGGKGTRLKELTKNLAKPAVPFGGKYRIIDFALSNCKNSSIDTVGILTQYKQETLKKYIADGEKWGLNRKIGGVAILQPNQYDKEDCGYEGTAHAVFENLRYIENQNPEYVLILSGDHIYKMDYSHMVEEHKQSGADATISVIKVPWSEAPRFGIMNIDSELNRVIEFEEKPIYPKSNLASMGIYLFNWSILKKFLEKEENNPYSSKDFGKDVIPSMLQDNCHLHAYQFDGYWKDVGTVQSFWEAHMDLLSVNTNPILKNEEWIIYTNGMCHPPMYLDENATLHQSIISEGCKVYGKVENSVLFYGVTVGHGAIIKDSVILPNTIIGENAEIYRSVVGSGSEISANVKVGFSTPFSEITLIGDNETIKPLVYK